jgi:Mg2+-importing ATPase
MMQGDPAHRASPRNRGLFRFFSALRHRRTEGPAEADDGGEQALRRAAAAPPAQLLSELGTGEEGLSNHEAAQRYAHWGPNSVGEEHRAGAWPALRRQIANPLSLLLLALAALSYAIGERQGAAVIASIVALSSLLSFLQEYRSGKAAAELRALVHTRATLRRRKRGPDDAHGGQSVSVPIVHIVPGDIVLLSAGNLIPADVRIILAKDLFVNQGALSGESLPVEKLAQARNGEAPTLEQTDLAFLGTYVTSGTGAAVVLATGARTRFGRLAREAGAAREPTSFDRGISGYVRLIFRFMVVLVPAVFLINGLGKGDWLQAFLFAIAVAVGMTPELLPVVITVNMAKGALAMARRRVIVKRLAAIQNFGAMDVLCTDKTGTLTQDRVVLERHVDAAGAESGRVLEFACINSVFQTGLRNLLDDAVLAHAELQAHVKRGTGYRKLDEIPFDFERRRLSVIVAPEDGSAPLLVCKGAVEEILRVCSRAERRGEVVPVEAEHLDELAAVTRELNEDGFRVIAVAYRELPPGRAVYSVADERDLVLLGYIAFLDPPKETAAQAIRELGSHGVAIKVLTGDNDAVTATVCRQVGLPAQARLLGDEVAAMTDAQLAERVERVTIFAKLAPHDKARVIRALRANGHVVGYLGDGINDGPALKAADVGVSVDSGADIAKDSADIVLLEKSLLVLDEGVREGRKVFGNVTKYLRMAGSSNFGNMFSMVGASALLPFLPMAPVQILLNNLLYDVSQTAVAADRVDADYLAQPRRWDIRGIGRYMLCIGPVSSLFDYATFGALVWLFDALGDRALFQTGWFVESLLSQTLIVHVIRTSRVPFLDSRPSGALLAMTIAVAAVGVWLPFSPFAPPLGLKPPPAAYWGVLAVLLAGYAALTQLVKTWAIRRFGLD